ncbi:DUF4352 domain-containing protein [Nocardiopsis lambiniae]|uniref:DUF4352 domain-containing protein n=1 Tax=Nocardiopsis lambiniae TaxID=3075539 RepID=A0ABU2MC14_9ACTN|nr:DUF4352 domain-containing protein [Nocardiopsis sp. DSM 44743]MDT0330102.1 DUF4352 domain-containing protein [Nocardiopsis sp. DSM 44743]
MTDREPEEGPEGRRQEPPRDPVNHHPPEEWRPGDPEDPMGGGPWPPGEPPHTFPSHDAPAGARPGAPEEGGHLPPPPGPQWVPPPLGGPGPGSAGATSATGPNAPSGPPPGGHPTGGPPEPLGGELSEGPNGPGQAGYEHAGYAPGYGESDVPGAGAGSYPQGSPPGVPYRQPPGYPPQGGYAPPEQSARPWGKIIGIGCGVLLLLLLVGGGCTAIGLVIAQSGPPTMGGSGPDEPVSPSTEEDGIVAELTADRTDFEPGPFYLAGDYTSVEVSVTNVGEDSLDVNPLYFSVIDVSGIAHDTAEAIGMDGRELDAVTLVPGQSTSGVVTVEGRVDADRVVFEPFYSEAVEIPVT